MQTTIIVEITSNDNREPIQEWLKERGTESASLTSKRLLWEYAADLLLGENVPGISIRLVEDAGNE